MLITLRVVFLALAILCFILSALRVQTTVALNEIGLAFFAASFLTV